ncbi:monofunctional biosynthetic peptidoglycan transglycosylase [Pararhodonellum marinum]|uniref:monofunctional biosynthetic peptidoglycan transglycosylase n=1 Tax=Pararhodonellum marinum TaxID=2755358 RepID=UPI00188E526B|nr:monofunctional biosynthetic peptidoglycan transglycosylase [Pararhodonellum marinum]
MKPIKKLIWFIGKIILWFFFLSIGLTILYRFVPVPFTPLMVIRMVEQASDGQRQVLVHKKWKPMKEISRHLPQAVVASEDQKFMSHFGFDTEEIQKAMKDREAGRRVRGASTISQQTAKNVFLWPGKNFVRKGLEAYFTLLIEVIWPKERILEVYLNVIEMGDGIYGVEAASQFYFKKEAAKISRQEAALIAAVLPNPLRWSPSKPTAYIRTRQNWIMRQMNNLEQLPFGQ